MQNSQPAILADVPPHSRYLFFSLKSNNNLEAIIQSLCNHVDKDSAVVGFGQSLINALGKNIDGLKAFPDHKDFRIEIPDTPAALWVWLRGDDRGELLLQSLEIEKLLSDSFERKDVVDAFKYKDSRDLSGYIDGTENPQERDAINAAIVKNGGEDMDGSSFVAVQQWVHDFSQFQSMSVSEQDDTIGRQISDNEEIEDAPESAHVKRTAQEDFDPEAFVVRRSMPWSDSEQAGLMFVAFGHSVDAFEALLNRMVGKDDDIVDALFKFTKPISGCYFWCPPVKDGRLNLSVLGIK